MAKAHCMAVARDPGTGASLLSATVNVYNPGTTTPISATIYDKNNNPLSNPLTSDSITGLIDFYLTVAQEVDLVVSKAAYTTRTYSNVPVIDDASFDLTALLTTTGDVAYASSANTPARLGIGSTNQLLTVSGGVPAWAAPVTNSTVNTNASGDTAISANTPTDVVNTGALASGTWLVMGTVTILMGGSTGIAECRLYDGTTVFASASLTITNATWGCLTVSGVVTGGATYRLNMYSSQAATAKQLGGASSTAAATHIRAVKVSN